MLDELILFQVFRESLHLKVHLTRALVTTTHHGVMVGRKRKADADNGVRPKPTYLNMPSGSSPPTVSISSQLSWSPGTGSVGLVPKT